MKQLFHFVIVAALLAAGCSKETDQPADREAPLIRLTSPANNQAFPASQAVAVAGTLTDNVKLYSMHIEITNTMTGAFITHEHFSPTGTSYDFSKTYTLPAGASYRVKVEAEDDNNNAAQATVTVSVN